MFQKLKQKWNVGPLQLVLILCTFAIGGSLSGYAAKKLLSVLDISHPVIYLIVYLIAVTLIWPAMVLLVSIPFGQYTFFKKYLKKLSNRLFKKSKKATDKPTFTANLKTMGQKIAIFASGAGSNAQKIIDYFRNNDQVVVSLIMCNKPEAGVLQIAAQEKIEAVLIEKMQYKKDGYTSFLKEKGIDFIILAGFLWKIPETLIHAYPQKIINIHPALLPDYGGKGMYGSFVHEAVIANKEKQSGITIHYVDEHYDHGDTIFQATCEVLPEDTPETLAQKIHQLEHEHFPRVIEQVINPQ